LNGTDATAAAGPATFAAAPAASLKPLTNKISGEPEAPTPITAEDSPAVKEAKLKTMPPIVPVQTVPDGHYTMPDPIQMARAAEVKLLQLRDSEIASNGGMLEKLIQTSEPQVKLSTLGHVLTTSGEEVEQYAAPTSTGTGYCKDYAARMDAKPKWTKEHCTPSHGTFEDIMKNIDGVLCACGGLKVANVPASEEHPGVQQSVLARAQVTKNRIRSYSYKLTSNVDKTEPQPEVGFTWEIRLTGQNATVNDHEVDPKKMRAIVVKMNRIFEFVDNSGAGLKEEDTKHLDPSTGHLWAGRKCEPGEMQSSGQPKQNCVVQDFFMDNFELADLAVEGKKMTFKFKSDIQGTTPWCSKDMWKTYPDVCEKPPDKKPQVTFTIGSDAGTFGDSKMNVYIENFPYKHTNSSLALAASVYATTVTPAIDPADELSAASASDGLDCSAVPPPSGCPQINFDDQVKLNWVKTILDQGSGFKQKVVVTEPARVRSGTVSSDGQRLVQKNMFFSFKHGMSKKLLWDPEIQAQPSSLPRSSASSLQALPSMLTVLASFFLMVVLG